MASEDVKPSESAVSTIVNLAEEAKLARAREGVAKAPSYALLSICKSLVAGGVAGGVLVSIFSIFLVFAFVTSMKFTFQGAFFLRGKIEATTLYGKNKSLFVICFSMQFIMAGGKDVTFL